MPARRKEPALTTTRVQVMVSPELLAKLDAMSISIGVPRSTFMTMLLADGVRSRENAQEFMQKFPDAIKGALSNPDVVKELSKSCPSE